jgi:hypothetical protein
MSSNSNFAELKSALLDSNNKYGEAVNLTGKNVFDHMPVER